MEQSFLLVLVALTSIGAYVIGVAGLGLSSRGLRTALGKLLECVGTALCFFLVNIGFAVAVIFLVRSVSGRFVSLYLVDDVMWLALSLLQGLAFLWWRELS